MKIKDLFQVYTKFFLLFIDTLYEELTILYPQIDIIPRTATPRFRGNNDQNNFTNRYFQEVKQFSLTEVEKIKMLFLSTEQRKLFEFLPKPLIKLDPKVPVLNEDNLHDTLISFFFF